MCAFKSLLCRNSTCKTEKASLFNFKISNFPIKTVQIDINRPTLEILPHKGQNPPKNYRLENFRDSKTCMWNKISTQKLFLPSVPLSQAESHSTMHSIHEKTSPVYMCVELFFKQFIKWYSVSSPNYTRKEASNKKIRWASEATKEENENEEKRWEKKINCNSFISMFRVSLFSFTFRL